LYKWNVGIKERSLEKVTQDLPTCSRRMSAGRSRGLAEMEKQPAWLFII